MADILLVEDDSMISRMLELRLKMRGHRVETAINGQIGLEKALANPYDIVLMDMHMPVLDGHAATRQLRDSGYDGLIVAVTASALSEDSEKAINSGCDAHISKPVGPDFEDRLEEIFRRGPEAGRHTDRP